jgi:hypothetical protein
MKFWSFFFLFLALKAYKYDEEFSCSSISAEISQKTSNYLDTTQPIDNKFKLIKKEISNDIDNYERWLSRDIKTGKYVHIKVLISLIYHSFKHEFSIALYKKRS